MTPVLAVVLVSGCAAETPTPAPSTIGAVPCAQYSTCLAYSSASGSDNGAPVAWLAAHPLRADYYASGNVGQLVLDGPVNSITLPLVRLGAIVNIDRSRVTSTLVGCAGSSPRCTQQGFLDEVLLTGNTVGFFDVQTGSITFTAGTKSITFEKR